MIEESNAPLSPQSARHLNELWTYAPGCEHFMDHLMVA
jgi:hypothetical protein